MKLLIAITAALLLTSNSFAQTSAPLAPTPIELQKIKIEARDLLTQARNADPEMFMPASSAICYVTILDYNKIPHPPQDIKTYDQAATIRAEYIFRSRIFAVRNGKPGQDLNDPADSYLNNILNQHTEDCLSLIGNRVYETATSLEQFRTDYLSAVKAELVIPAEEAAKVWRATAADQNLVDLFDQKVEGQLRELERLNPHLGLGPNQPMNPQAPPQKRRVPIQTAPGVISI